MLDDFLRDCACSAHDTTSYATAFDEMRKAVSAYYAARGAELIMSDFQLAKAPVALGLKLESTWASGTHREVPGFPGVLEDAFNKALAEARAPYVPKPRAATKPRKRAARIDGPTGTPTVDVAQG